jgi:phage pi2 protein 07
MHNITNITLLMVKPEDEVLQSKEKYRMIKTCYWGQWVESDIFNGERD